MTINDQIGDEKLQHDINRKAAEISALSSGKINKYEYLTGPEILPSNQQQTIEQAKFTYSPSEKAFEKQTKTIEYLWQKQVEVLKGLEPSNKPSISKEIYNLIFEERMDEILEMSREINFSNLVYHFKGLSPSISFTKFEGSMYNYNQLKNGDKILSQVQEDQKDFRSELGQITSGRPKDKSNNQKDTIKNVKNLYNSRQKIVDLLNDNSRIRSKAIYKVKKNNKTIASKITNSFCTSKSR